MMTTYPQQADPAREPHAAQPEPSAFDAYELPPEAAAAEADTPSAAETIEAYTPEELAQLLSALSQYGVPVENLDAYQRALIARARPAIELLDVSGALLEYGVGKGGPGLGALPAWARLLAGAGAVGLVVYATRKEHGASGPNLEGAASAGAAGAGAEGAGARDA